MKELPISLRVALIEWLGDGMSLALNLEIDSSTVKSLNGNPFYFIGSVISNTTVEIDTKSSITLGCGRDDDNFNT